MADIVIQGGKIYTLSPQGTIDKGYVVIEDGIIQDVGEGAPPTRGKELIEVQDFVLIPGLVDPHTHIGIYRLEGEIGDHGVETSDPITPQLSVLDALDRFDPAFEDAISAGVTTVGVLPGNYMSFGKDVERISIMPGQYSIVKCNGKVIKPFAGIKMAVGEHPKRFLERLKKVPTTRMGIYGLLRSYLTRAKEYGERKEGGEILTDFKLEPLLSLLNGKVNARIHAHLARDILSIIRLAEETGIKKLVIDHGTESYLVADILREKNIPVVFGPLLFSRRGTELKNLSIQNIKILHNKGITFSLTTDHPTIPIQYYSLIGSLIISEVVAYEDALRALTINPAKILGLDDRLGTIETGKEADIAILNGEPFDPRTQVVYTLIDGEVVYRGDKNA